MADDDDDLRPEKRPIEVEKREFKKRLQENYPGHEVYVEFVAKQDWNNEERLEHF